LIERCLSLMEKEIRSNGISLTEDLQNIPSIMVDSSRITQVLFNIMFNAIQAMPSGGHLTIKSWHDFSAAGLLNIDEKTEVIHISFADTGIGIPKESLSYIFTPFFTTKKAGGGVGLGLSVAYEIVELFKGNIFVESEVDTGTKFTVNLPIAR
jgi:signal transduction histidine kinase